MYIHYVLMYIDNYILAQLRRMKSSKLEVI